MKTLTPIFNDPDFQKAGIALRRAAANARKLSRQTKTPFIVYQDGKIVDLNAPKKPKAPKKTTDSGKD